MLYGIIILIAAAHAVAQPSLKSGIGKILLVLCFIYWGLSYCNGYDWINYFSAVECERLNDCEETHTSFEPFFLILTKVASRIDYQIIPLAAGAAGIFIICRLIPTNQTSGYAILYFLSVTAYYLYIEQVRQGIALAFLFVAADRLVLRRWKSTLCFWILAMQFHWTSVLFALPAFLIFASKRQLVLATATLAGAIAALTSLSLDTIISLAAQSSISELDIVKRLFFYTATEDMSSSAIGLGFALDLALLLIVIFAGRGIDEVPGINYRLTVIFYFILLLISRVNISIYRTSIIFLPFTCMYLSMLTNPKGQALRFFGKATISRKAIGFALTIICVGQAVRPFTDPVLEPTMMRHGLFGLTALPSDKDRQIRSIESCDRLDQLDKGFLCGRW